MKERNPDELVPFNRWMASTIRRDTGDRPPVA